MTNKHVCLILHPFYWMKDSGRGIDRYNYELVNNLRELGIIPLVMASGFIKSIPEGAIKEAIFPLRLIRERAGLYHATHPIGGKTAALLRKKPLITTVHDIVPYFFRGIHDFGLHYKFKFLSFKLAAQRSNRVIVGSEVMKTLLSSLARVSRDRIEVIHYGIDHEKFFPQIRTARKTRRVLFLGEVVFEKGIDTLLESFRLVETRLSHVELTIGGKGRDLPSAMRFAERLGISHKVKFLGHVPDSELPELYNSSEVFVFPSRYGFALPTLEAMACGTPTIYGATFDAPEYLGNSAVPVNPDDVERLSDAISRVLTDNDLREELSRNGIERAADFSWARMARETARLYDEVLTSG